MLLDQLFQQLVFYLLHSGFIVLSFQSLFNVPFPVVKVSSQAQIFVPLVQLPKHSHS